MQIPIWHLLPHWHQDWMALPKRPNRLIALQVTSTLRGICPECYAAWKDTQCLRCHQWSLHDDWYATDED